MAVKNNSFRSLIAASGQAPVAEAAPAPSTPAPQITRRSTGKRTAPDYIQVGLYLPKQLHRQAKLALLSEGEERDFSELVRDLLAAHLKQVTS